MGGLWLLQQPRGYIASWNGRVAALVAKRLYSLLEWAGCCCSSSLEVIQPPGMGGLWLLQQPRGYVASWNGWAVAALVAQRLYASWNGWAVAALVAQRLYSLLEWVGCGCCNSLEVIQPPEMGRLWLLQQPRGYIASWNGRAMAAVVAQRLYNLLEWVGCGCSSSLEVIQPPGMGRLLLLQQPRGYIASWNGWAVAAVVAQRLYSLLEWAGCGCCSSLGLYSLLEWAGCGCCSSLEVIQPPGMGRLLLLQQSRGYIASWNGRAVAAVVAQRLYASWNGWAVAALVAQKLYSLLEWVGCGCCNSLDVIQPPGMGGLWLLQQPRGYIASWNGRAVAAVVAQRLYSILEWVGYGFCSSLEVIQPPGMGGLWLLWQPRGYIASWNGWAMASVVAQRLYSLLEWAGCGCCGSLDVIQPPGMGGLLLIQQSRGYIVSWNVRAVAAVVAQRLYIPWNGWAVAALVAQRLYSLLEWVGCGCCSSLDVKQPPGMGGLWLLQQPWVIQPWAMASVVAQRLYSLLEWAGCGCCSSLEVIQPPGKGELWLLQQPWVIQPPGMGGLWLLQQPRGYIASWNGWAMASVVAQRLYSLLEWAGCGCCSSLEVIQPPGKGGLWLLQQPWVIQPPGMGGLWLLQQPRGYIASWNGWAMASVVAQRLYSLLEWAGCGCCSSLDVIQPPGMGGLWLLQQPWVIQPPGMGGLWLLQQPRG